MQVVLLVAALVILGGVVLAALGRVGEMATFASDTPPMDLDEVSATDVALLRPPMSLWGYNAQATEDALRVIARSVTARDVEIATLRRELADLRGNSGDARGNSGDARGNSGDARATRTGPVNLPGQPPPAASLSADLLAAYRPPPPAGESRPAGQVPEPRPAGQARETQPAGQAPHAEPPDKADPRAEADPPAKADPAAKADPSAEDDWLPLWQRSSEPGPDE